MSAESFILGKDASRASSTNCRQATLLALGLPPSLGLGLANGDGHQRRLTACGKLHKAA